MVTSPYPALEPWMWRSLLARAAVFHAVRTKLSEFCDHVDRGGDLHDALRDLETRARECAARDIDDETTVTLVVESWDARLTEQLGLTQLDAEARELLAELQVLMRCARAADPFRAIFAGITALASALYGDAWRSATLGVAHIRRHPRGTTAGVDPYAVTATTRWPPDESGAHVELYIHCDAFGPAAFAALQMLLTHECVCHVPARQDRASNDSTFAEGLLDWVAYLFHEQWASKLDIELAPAARWHAQGLHKVLTGHVDSPESRARRVGHTAAETLRVWFERVCNQDWQESKLSVARLAVALNKVQRPLADKDHFVSLLGRPLPEHLDNALREWDAGRLDADALLDGLVRAA